MPKREQVDRTSVRRRDTDQEEQPAAKAPQDTTLAEDLDEILDEIDEVLEKNAQEFVESYVQKGGE